jgi:hypothetical protein
MNLRTTLLLLVLAAGGAAYWFRDAVSARLGYTATAADTPDTLYILRRIRPDSITRVEVNSDGKKLELVREGKTWSLPGGWPTRGPEVQELVDLLTGLDSRFEPIRISGDTDLTPYGLAASQKPVAVTVAVAVSGTDQPREFHLSFGEPPGQAGNRFTRPTYFRLEGHDEILRASPGMLLVLNRTQDDYRKRQLFPDVERARVGDPRPNFPGEPDVPQPAVALIDARQIQVTGPDGTWALQRKKSAETSPAARKPGAEVTAERLAEDWELTQPVVDRIDPDKLKAALTAVPELWVENFVAVPNLAEAGLDKPERTLKVETDKRTVDLLLGKVSREVERKAPPPPPNPFGAPPPPPPAPVKETYRYAKLAGNPQVFEVKADKLGGLFAAPAAMRDPRLVRFRPADARRVEVDRPDGKIALTDARDETAKEDRWKLTQPVQADADPAKITELLDRVAELRAEGPDVIDKADPKAYGLDVSGHGSRIAVELSEPKPGDEKARQPRKVVLRIGRRDSDKKKVYVQVEGNPRIDAVADDFLKLFDRPALAYRGRRVIDVPVTRLTAITVQRPGEQFKLEQVNGAWKLSPPGDAKKLVDADGGKAATLAGDLSRLEAVEFVNDKPTPEELAKYGLSAPTLTATLTSTDAAKPAKTLQIGNPREGKPEVYAKLADGPGVFTVRDSLKTVIDMPSLAYRPPQLWQVAPESITAIEVQRGTEKYRLTREGGGWKLTGPFDAPASAQAASALVNQVAAPRAERFEAHAVGDAAKYGLDKPALRLTVFMNAGEPKSITIGNPAAADVKSRFAKAGDSDAVAVVPAALAAAADRPALDLIDPEVLSINANLISSARGTGPDGPWELKKDGDWKVASTKPPTAADQLVVRGLLRPWADLRAERFAAFGPQVDWAKFGLEKPAETVTVTSPSLTGDPKPETHTLSLGKPTESNDGRYARLDDRPAVFVLPTAVAGESTKSPLDLVDRTLFAFDPAELIALRRTGPAGDLDVTKKDDGWQIVKPDSHRADQPGMDELAERLGGLRAAKVAELNAKDLKPFGLDSPQANVTVVLKGKDGKESEKKLHVGVAAKGRDAAPGGGGEHCAQVDGQSAVFVLPALISKRLVAEPIKFRDRSIAHFADADRVFVEHGARKVIFAKLDNTWKMTEPTAAEAESTELGDLVQNLSRLRADELVAEKPEDLKAYGLDEPEARWRVLAGDREVLNLLVGKRDAASGRNYAKLAGGDLVFLLSPDLSNRLLAEYRKRTLWTGVDAASVETLVYAVGDQTLVLQKANDGWQVPGRPDQQVNTAAVNDLLGVMAGLKVERYVVDKGADLKQYGLQPPQRTIVARTRTSVTATLYLGNMDDGSKRLFARILDPNRTDVFVLSEADSQRLMRDTKSFVK